MAFRDRLQGLLSGADPMGNLGLGLLSASGPSPVKQSLGQILGQGVQFASGRQQAAMQNDAMRAQLLQRQKQQKAQEQIAGLLSGGEGATPQQLMGLLAQASPDAFNASLTEGLLAQMNPKPQDFGSPIGKLFGDRAIVEAQGNAEAVAAIDAAIQAEIGPEVDLSKVLQLRDDVTRNSTEYLAAESGFNKVTAAAASDSPAADMAMIFGYMKVLDPASIVREGEFATVANSAGIPERIRGTYNNILRGERLTPEQRQDFLSQARAQFAPLVEQQQRLVRDAQSFAERNKLPFEDIVPQFVMPTMPPPIDPPKRDLREGVGSLVGDITRDIRNLTGRPESSVKRFVFNPQTQQLEAK